MSRASTKPIVASRSAGACDVGCGSIWAVVASPQKPLAASAYPSHTGPGCRSSADLLLCANERNRSRGSLRQRSAAARQDDRS